MIADLPEVSRKRGRQDWPKTPAKRRAVRISYPTQMQSAVREVGRDVMSDVIKNELRNAGKDLVYYAMQRTVDTTKQDDLKKELVSSQAISSILTRYLGVVDNVPSPCSWLFY